MRYALVDVGRSAVTFLSGSPDDYPDLRDAGVLVPAGDEVEVGWRWDGNAWSEPNNTPSVPDVIPAWKGKVVLDEMGLLAQVEAIVAQAGGATAIAWNNAAEWVRQSTMLAALATALGLTDAQVDDMFRAAIEIVG